MLGDYRITARRATEIAAEVEALVASGVLAPGAALPPLRDLAVELGVNPNTVAAAYRLLRERGVIETAGRRGSRILPRPALTPRDYTALEVPEGVRDLADGNPDARLLPDPTTALAAAGRGAVPGAGRYGGPEADPGLLAVARRSFVADGVPAEAIGVASGALDAQERIFQAWLRPGDAVAVEDPGWGSLFDLLPALGLKPRPVAVDDDGMTVEGLREALDAGVRAVVVTARAQNPTGATLGAERATQLRALLAGHPEVLLVEDDHGHGIVDQAYQALCAAPGGGAQGAATVRHWAVVRSVAKSLGPDLRVAVVAGDRETVDRVRGRQRLGAGWVSHLLQRTAAALWEAYDPAPTAASYRARRDALVAALASHGIAAHGRSGLYVWIPVADETSAVAGLLQRGWAVSPGARYRLHAAPGLRLTVSTLDLSDCAPLAADLAAVLLRRPGATSSVRGV
ncbi:aminotransferase class I/II-fold pyridoxal phosphate-dependent enzyme [Streptacidiphilus jiangxiensis]|uniref:DNA-binding transcriptional regulator, MocR family, contains an aminotransferase domain n=1 Tax=Streptacidiphilus jiangxiensis TaxID=235985 RepID=A0A1H7Y821_STRJI|nr:aminotransferase class I/II-fold pyridoxal phosphate-dependent enzyme [Streptacidiphilus jiangxiensis]SEM42024.1 DNA-binding transcriptional regulator, MocR family, contains an aminotransferase domain [Streptacidiphilus jiangxiensis]